VRAEDSLSGAGTDVCSRHLLAEPFRDGSEVLAHYKASVPLAFQSQDPDQVIERVANTSAVGRGAPLGDAVEVLQAHDVVDAEPSGMTHIGADELDEAAVSLFPQCVRMKRRKTPVLARRIKDVRRRADMRASQKGFGIQVSAPDLSQPMARSL
jgi:hypothetical protein